MIFTESAHVCVCVHYIVQRHYLQLKKRSPTEDDLLNVSCVYATKEAGKKGQRVQLLCFFSRMA